MKMKKKKGANITPLFGYALYKEFHGPLEIVFSFVPVIDVPCILGVCKDFLRCAKNVLVSTKYSTKEISRWVAGMNSKKTAEEYQRIFCYMHTFGNNLVLETLSRRGSETLVQACVKFGLTELFKVCFPGKGERNIEVGMKYNNEFIIRKSAELGKIEIVKHLVTNYVPGTGYQAKYLCSTMYSDRYCNPFKYDSQAYRLAAANGHAEVVKLLMERQLCEINADGGYAMSYAIKNRHLSVVKVLLDFGWVLKNSRSLFADIPKDLNVMKLFLANYGKKMDKFLWKMMQGAVEVGNMEVVKFLLRRNKKILSRKYTSGQYPLVHAVCKERVEMIKLFLKDEYLNVEKLLPAIETASIRKSKKIVEILILDPRLDTSKISESLFKKYIKPMIDEEKKKLSKEQAPII